MTTLAIYIKFRWPHTMLLMVSHNETVITHLFPFSCLFLFFPYYFFLCTLFDAHTTKKVQQNLFSLQVYAPTNNHEIRSSVLCSLIYSFHLLPWCAWREWEESKETNMSNEATWRMIFHHQSLIHQLAIAYTCSQKFMDKTYHACLKLELCIYKLILFITDQLSH